MTIDRAHVLVLNYNGQTLLRECLPSIEAAVAACPMPCALSVVDNGSTDNSPRWLADNCPAIHVIQAPNLGLISFNQVLAAIDEPAAILLNNDVKLAANAVAPLLDALRDHPDALFSAPQCWTFDGALYEGMRTRVRTRRGLIQGLCRVPGHEQFVNIHDLTAAAGPVLAVHRERFLAVGGYDPLYLPGRLEDLDLGFTGWTHGWRGYYVPESLAYHQGMASFGPAFGKAGCDRLALRNSLLFAWKNLRGLRLWQHFAWVPLRLVHAAVTLRADFPIALMSALKRWRSHAATAHVSASRPRDWLERQESFFQQFSW